MAFRCVGSPLDEIKRLETLREQDPESAVNLVANGKLLVDFTHDGNLRALQCAVEHLEEGQVLIFYAVRMFREACNTKRLDILRFLLANGFDLQQSYMRDVLHNVIENINNPQHADDVQPLIRFLLDAGVDVNWQRKSDLYTALHVACCKNLYPIAYLLVLYGADVNAIAADDAMPLTCANKIGQAQALSDAEQLQKEMLVSFLVENQARETWRRQPPPAAENASTTTPECGDSAVKRPILSFSSSFGIHCNIDESTDNQHLEGLMFDTSDSPEDLNKNTGDAVLQRASISCLNIANRLRNHAASSPESRVPSTMSCSLIEAKFQVLDRTIKMLSQSKSLRTPKVVSSEQLRELVETQKPTSLLPTLNPVKGVVTRSTETHSSINRTSRSQPNTAREEKSEKRRGQSAPRPSTGRRDLDECSTDVFLSKWVDPKQRRAEQLLQETWHEIESAVNWGQTSRSATPESLRSKLLYDNAQDDRPEQEWIPSQSVAQDQYTNNQIKADTEDLTSAVHNALPVPKRPLTSTGLQPKISKAYLSTRCRSASFNAADHQPKNWFTPSAIGASENLQQASQPRHKICRQRPVVSARKQTIQHQSRDKSPSPQQFVPKPQPEIEVVGESEKTYPLPSSKPDDPSFYMLELRLVHPERLTNWRFQASFTDTSVNPAKTVILDDLTADEENCLLFDDFQASEPTRFFNPFLYFPGLSRPSDLYGHVLRIIVTSLQPVTRIVINTSVQFTRFPDEAVVDPPANPSRTNSNAVAAQEASLLRVLTLRNNSASSASKQKKPIAKPRPKHPKPSLKSNNEDSTTSLAMDQCSPWASNEQDDCNSDGASDLVSQILTLHLDETRSPSPAASPRKGPTADHLDQSPRMPMTTIDKKKMQLQRLRANIRREMRDEKTDNSNL